MLTTARGWRTFTGRQKLAWCQETSVIDRSEKFRRVSGMFAKNKLVLHY